MQELIDRLLDFKTTLPGVVLAILGALAFFKILDISADEQQSIATNTELIFGGLASVAAAIKGIIDIFRNSDEELEKAVKKSIKG